jgi:hypothetical protein
LIDSLVVLAETKMNQPNKAPIDRQHLDTYGKALQINLDKRRYGTFAEIGAGQEVVRWFFQAGGAAGTIAKSMSAYDMTVSDAIYGTADRYVSRSRLEAMLDHEHRLNLERLSATRGDLNSFFAFADTVEARNFRGTNECHGWMGVRYQVYPRDQDSQIVLHVRLLDPSNLQQQEALGIVGVNLLYGAFFLHHEPNQLLESLLDGLGPNRIEIDMIEFSGIGFRSVDNRLMSLMLVQLGLSKAAMIAPNGKVLQASEVFHKRPVLVQRGSFRPVTKVNLDILRAAEERFVAHLPEEDKGRIVSVAEITMRNLTKDCAVPDVRDFLGRTDVLAAAGLTVVISDYSEFYKLAGYLRKLTAKPIGVALGAITVPEIFDSQYYTDLDGGLLESIGRLFRGELTLFVYPYREPASGKVMTVDNLELPPNDRPLYEYLRRGGRIVGLDNHDHDCLGIYSTEVLGQIARGDQQWEHAVPANVASMIKERKLFGCRH